MIYAVIDTNVVVSALITKHRDSSTVKVLKAVLEGKVVPVLNNDILKEYDAVLRRKKFHLDNNIIDRIVNYFRTFGINKAPVTSKIKMPDEDDRVFYEVSLSIEDSFLVTGNLKSAYRTCYSCITVVCRRYLPCTAVVGIFVGAVLQGCRSDPGAVGASS